MKWIRFNKNNRKTYPPVPVRGTETYLVRFDPGGDECYDFSLIVLMKVFLQDKIALFDKYKEIDITDKVTHWAKIEFEENDY